MHVNTFMHFLNAFELTFAWFFYVSQVNEKKWKQWASRKHFLKALNWIDIWHEKCNNCRLFVLFFIAFDFYLLGVSLPYSFLQVGLDNNYLFFLIRMRRRRCWIPSDGLKEFVDFFFKVKAKYAKKKWKKVFFSPKTKFMGGIFANGLQKMLIK